MRSSEFLSMRKLQIKALMRGGVGGLCGLLLLLAASVASAQIIEFLPGAPSVYENGGGAGTNVTIVITRTPATGASTVQFSTVDGSATSPADYTGNSFTVSFIDGESFQIVSIPIVDDLVPEGTETFTVMLSNPTGGTLGANSNSVVTIFDNDNTFRFIPTTNVVVAEDQTNVMVFVERTGDLSGSASVDFYTADISARSAPPALADYTSLSGTLVFTNGQGTNVILVSIIEDCRVEPIEFFQVILTNGVGGTVSALAGVTTVGITDNDTAAGTIEFGVISVNAGPIVLADPDNPLIYEHLTTTITYRIVRRQACDTNNNNIPFSGSATVDINIPSFIDCPGTDIARRGTDYTVAGLGANDRLTINGTEATFTITIINDGFVELDEVIALTLSIPNQNPLPALGDRRSQSVTIRSDDLPAGGVDPFYNVLNFLNPTPGANNEVLAVAVIDATNSVNNGKSYIGGDFTAVNAVVRNRIARINVNGLVDTSFDPGDGADGFVDAIVVQPDGKVLIAGGFSAVNGISRVGVARLNEDGSLDNGFMPGNGVRGVVYDMTLQADGKIVIVGDFDSYNNTPVRSIARLFPNGTLDTQFAPGAGPDAPIHAVAIRGTTSILNVGAANSGSGAAEYRTNVNVGANFGTVTVNFDFACVPDTLHIYYGPVSPANLIYDSGLTNNYYGQDCLTATNYQGIITVTVPFGPGPYTDVTIIINEGSGDPGTVWSFDASIDSAGIGQQIYVGGEFTTYDNASRGRIARLNGNGTLDTNFVPVFGADNTVYSVLVQTNDTAIIAGVFDTFDGQSRHGIARLTTNGVLDTTFNPGTGVEGVVYDLVQQRDGLTIIAGDFSSYNDTPRGNIARLYADGTLDTSFLDIHYNQTQPGVNGFLNAVDLQNDGRLIVGGSFSVVGGGIDVFGGMVTNAVVPRFNYARLNGGTNPEAFNMPGNVQFVSAQYSIDENVLGGLLTVTVERVNGRYGPLTATITSVDGTAIAGTDFQPVNTTVSWADCSFGTITFQIPILNNNLIQGNRTFSLVISNPVSIAGIAPSYPSLAARSQSTVTIVDDDFARGVVGFSQPVFTVAENGGTAVVNVTRTNGSVGSVTVEYTTYNLSALAGSDYVAKSSTLTFGSGITNQTITVTITDDGASENEEWFGIRLTNIVGATLGLSNSTVLILDNEVNSRGSISFVSGSYSVNESNGTASVALRRTSGAFGTLTASIATFDFPPGAGNARSNIDYVSLSTNVTFAAGVITQVVTVPILDDNFVEGNEQLGLQIISVAGGGTIGFQSNAVLTIVEDDAYGRLALRDVNFFVNERGTNASITVIRTEGTSEEVSVDFATSAITATDGTDYLGTNGTLIFSNGVSMLTFTIPIINDNDLEYNETLAILLTNFQKATPGLFTNGLLTIIDDEALDLPAGSVDPTFESHPNGFVNALGLQSDGRLVIGGDFTGVNGFPQNRVSRLTLTGTLDPLFKVGTGANNKVHAIAIQPDDKIIIGGRFSSYNSTNRSGIARLNADGTIDSSFNPGAGADNPVFAVALTAQGKVVLGGSFTTVNGVTRPNVALLNTNGSVDLTFNTGVGLNGTVYAVAVQPDGKILVGGDFTTVNNTNRARIARINANGSLDLSFNAGAGPSNAVRAILVQTNGSIVIGGSFTNVSGTAAGYITRLLPGGAVDPSFNAGWGADAAVLALALQENNKIIAVGDFHLFNGVSRNRITRLNADGSIDPTINFGTGANSFISAVLVQDDESIVIGGGFTEFNGISRQYVARLIGGENIGAGTFAFLEPVIYVDENGSNAVVTVIRNGGTTGLATVDFSTFDGVNIDPYLAAVAPADYATTNGTLVFPQGETLRTFTVPIVNNAVAEGDKLLFLSLFNATGGAALDLLQSEGAMVILEDDSLIQFLTSTYSVNEGTVGQHAVIELIRTGTTNNSVSVFFTTTPGTATDGADYLSTNTLVIFAPGEMVKVVTVPVFEDLLNEGPETVGLVLTNPAALNSPSSSVSLGLDSATLTIVDNDFQPGEFTFITSSNFVNEAGSFAVITVLRTNGSSGLATVQVTQSDVTATSGLDYENTSGPLSFPEGETVQTVTIPINDDAVLEQDEIIGLALSNPTGGATLGAITNATLTILDDEFGPSFVGFSTNNFFVNEFDGFATISVVRTNSRRGAISVNFSISNGSATAGLDYVVTNGTLSFADGVSVQTFTVPIINDGEGEGDETVRLALSGFVGTGAITLPTSTLTIVDDDTALRFSSPTYTVAENGGSALITVLRGGVTNVAVSVNYATAPGGTAVAGLDYTPVSGVLSWVAGDAAPKTFTVPIIDNTSDNPPRTVLLVLSNAVGFAASVGSPSNAVLTITDDETQNPVSGIVDPTFNGNFGANANVRAVAYDTQQRLYVGGDFTQFHGLVINRIARLNRNGAVDFNFKVGSGADAPVYSIAPVTNALYIAGAFTNVNGVPRGRVTRLRTDGSVDAGFAPNGGANALVRAVAVTPNEQPVIGGDFTIFNGIAATRVARLNTNGTLDTSFAVGSGPNLPVRAVAVQTNNGQVVIGGEFTSVSGFLVTRIARLNTDGSLDTTFATGLGADGAVNSIAIQSDGKILIAGEFVTINGVPRNRVARLNADGSVDTSFDIGAGADAAVRAVAVELDGHVLVVGDFTTFDGNPLRGVARLNNTGSLDGGFVPGSGADAPVRSIGLVSRCVPPPIAVMNFNVLAPDFVEQSDYSEGCMNLRGVTGGHFHPLTNDVRGTAAEIFEVDGTPQELTLGGFTFSLQSIYFTNIFGSVLVTASTGGSVVITTDGLFTFDTSFAGAVWVRFDVTGVVTVDDITIVPGPDALLPQSFAIGGDFEEFNNVQRGGVAVLTISGGAEPAFDPRNISTRSVYSSAIYTNPAQPAVVGKVLVGGDFTAIVGVDGVNRLARLNIDGTLDTTFASGQGPNAPVRAIAIQPDGKAIFGGFFTSYDFIARAYVARINADGTLDNTFNFGAGLNNAVLALALQPDGRVVVGGTFTIVYGTSRNAIARLNSNGTVDTSFIVGSGANGPVQAVALQSDGKILIGGDFTSFNGTPRAHIARLNTNGTLDVTFDPGTGANGAVNAIAVTSTGSILIGGAFTTVNGAVAPRLARLTSSGSLDGTFNPGSGANDYVSSIAVQPDGRIVVGGNFTQFNGQIRNRLVRLNSDGSLDPTTNFGAGANDLIATIALQNYDGKIVVGGSFTEFDGLTRVAVARLFGGTNIGSGTFRFSDPTYTVGENGINAVLLVLRSGGTMGPASVSYSTVNGSATSPADYTAVSGTLFFADAESVKQVLVPIVDNTSTTGDRAFSVTLFNPSAGAMIGVPSNAVVTILENDSVISFSSADYLVNEDALVARISVTRSGGTIDPATVDFATGTNGTATVGLDFTAVAGTLLFPAGVTLRTFDVPIIDDTFNEFNETVPLMLFNPTGSSGLGLPDATLTIVENDFGPGLITFGTNSYFASEDGGPIVIQLFRTNGHSGAVRVNYQTLIGTATPNVDYRATNGFVDFADGQTNAFITILPIDDLLTEGNETVPVQLFAPSGGATLGISLATITIVDNDAPGTFVFSAPTYSIGEAGGSAIITVIRTNGNQGAVGVTVQTSGGSAIPTIDYTPVPPTVLSFNAGQTVRTFTIPILNDALPEGTETVGLLLSNPTGGTSIGVPGAATLSILDDETSVGFASAALSVAESFTNVVVTLVRIGNTNNSFSVTLNTSDGSATAGADYVSSTTTVTFAPGQTNLTLTVAVLDDTLAEGDETVNLTLSSPSGGVVLGPIGTSVLTILDNDTAYIFNSATYATNEGTVDLVITVLRTGFNLATGSVEFATSDGTATAALDYLSATGRLAFVSGQTSATFNVRILDDTLVEGNETINLTLFNPLAPGFLGPQATAVITILDNDTSVGFSQTNYIVNENITNAVITIVRNGGGTLPVSVGFRTQNGTAVAGQDYTFVTNNVTWAANDVAPKTILIPITPDGTIEGAETVNLFLSNPINATIDPAFASAVLTIVDNAGVIAFASANYSVVEGSGNALLNLVRTGGSNGVVSVQWNVVGGSATPGQDYFGSVGTVVFAAGETVKPILLPIGEDGITEGVETVNFTLSNAGGGARVGNPNTAILSILDNDTGIIVGAGSSLIFESFLPTNNIIEPGETVTLLFALRNAGLVDANNVMASLVYANGVTNSSPQTQNYGALIAGGNSVSRPFTFTALGTNGTRITATLMITNNGLFLGTVSFDFVLGNQNIPFQNAGVITIPAEGQATPYPATLSISGVGGPVNKLTVTLHNVTHPFPADLDVLLVAPNGVAVMLMSDAGNNNPLNGTTITFDDAAAFAVPQFGVISNGSYRCANYPPGADSMGIPSIPNGSWTNNPTLATYNGISPNGVWSLYVFDDTFPDAGAINGGWSLNIATADPVIPGADLSVTINDSPDPVGLGGTVTYSVGVTNHGPAAASSVMLTNVLPANANFISVSGPGSYTINGNVLLGSLGNIPMGVGVVVTVTMTAQNTPTQLTFDATVSAGTTDLNSVNDHASVKTTVTDVPPLPLLFVARKNSQIVLSWQSAETNIVLESGSLLTPGSWNNATGTLVVSNGASTVTVPMDANAKFYRLKRVP